ncbi:hypothetical protein ACWGK6_39400 [Streptomyces violaceusniger]
MDDFALRRRHRYATSITDAETERHIAVLPGRDAATYGILAARASWC